METPRDRLKVRFALERADEVIAVSTFLADQIRRHGITRPITVVPNVVDTNRFPSAPSRHGQGEPYKLLFAGILRDHNKNLPLLLHALKRLTPRGNYQLAIVGDGEVRAECELLALALGIREQCRFLGALDPSRLSQELAESDVFVLPSKTETFGIVAAEALSVGRPVVATRCGGPEDFITSDVGALVANDDADAMATAIEDVCRNLGSYDAGMLSDYARRRFGFEAIASRLTEIYSNTRPRGARVPRAAMLI
jgi:glycosyltransferase involved in cell wall biosynthesis